MTLIERLWRLLPDKCQVINCERHGVRGNESRIAGKMVCDYCNARNGHLDFGMGSSWWDRHPRLRWLAVIGYMIFAVGGLICFTIAMLR